MTIVNDTNTDTTKTLKGVTGAEALRRGMASANGAGGTVNLVDAHRWFNIAAVLGEEKAAVLRSETALDMTKRELAAALRAAREFMTLH